MRDMANSELDRIDRLRVGQGMLEAYAFGRGDLYGGGEIGGALEYGHRVTHGLSLYGGGEIGYRYGLDSGLGWQALLGARWRL